MTAQARQDGTGGRAGAGAGGEVPATPAEEGAARPEAGLAAGRNDGWRARSRPAGQPSETAGPRSEIAGLRSEPAGPRNESRESAERRSEPAGQWRRPAGHRPETFFAVEPARGIHRARVQETSSGGGGGGLDEWAHIGVPLSYDPERDPYRVYLDRLDSASSRRTMRGCLDRIAQIVAMDETGTVTGAGRPWWWLRYEHTTRIRAELRSRTGANGGPAYSPASINKHLVALRQVLRECWRLGLMSAEDYQRAADLASVEGSRLPRGHHLPGQALGAALAVCDADTSPAGRRDAALLGVLYSTGARRAEIAGLALADYDPAERSLRVRGKRGKERLVYVTVEAAARLDAWTAVRGRTPGALFPPISKGGRCRSQGERLAHPTGQAIAGIVTRRLTEAGVDPHTPHDFRRTFIGELLDAGVDLATAQQLAGHASPATTARYDRRPQRRRREAVDRLQLP